MAELEPSINFINLLQNPAANAEAVRALGQLIEISSAGQVLVLFNNQGEPEHAWLNSTASRILGETSATFLSGPEEERWSRFLHPADTLSYLRDDAELIRNGGQAQHIFRIMDPQSRDAEGPTNYLWIAEDKSVILDPTTNRTVGALATLQDVTRMGVFAYQDGLTGLHNRNYLDEYWKSEYNRLQRLISSNPRQASIGFLVCDIDNLKDVNDKGGHLEGDRAIMATANFLRDRLRDYDMLIRWGGDEFLILTPSTTRVATRNFAKRLHQDFEAALVKSDGFTLTMSIGYYHANLRRLNLSAEEAFTLFFKITDAALYKAKAAGRNRVVEGR